MVRKILFALLALGPLVVVLEYAGLGDIQGGMGRVRMPVGTLNHFTATAGPDIVRGHRMPPDLVGDLLFTEPVGRLIRRTKIVKDQGLTQLQIGRASCRERV